MTDEKDKNKWPEHTSWWDRHELKINWLLWGSFFILLFIARELIVRGVMTFELAVIWFALFVFDLFLLSFTSNGVNK